MAKRINPPSDLAVPGGQARLWRVVAILTVHNRRDDTLRCLQSLVDQEFDGDIRAVVVDDGSSDGTAELIAGRFPQAEVLHGTGHLFWAAGMAMAEARAAQHDPDYLLWLNDDVELQPFAVASLITVELRHKGSIVVGSVKDPESDETTYGGLLLDGRHPLRVTRVEAFENEREVDAMNGNVVLVSRGARDRVGTIDGGFSHAFADIDYSLRARAAHVPIYLAAGSLGLCRRVTETTSPASMSELWRLSFGRKEFDLRSRVRLLRRHQPVLWPILVTWTALHQLGKFATRCLHWRDRSTQRSLLSQSRHAP